MYRYVTGTTTIPEATQIAGQYVSKGDQVFTYGAGLIKSGQYLWNANQKEVRKILRMTTEGFQLESAFPADVSVAEDIYTISMTEVKTEIYNNGDADAIVDSQNLPAYAPTILKLDLTYPIVVDGSGTQLLVTETAL